MTKEIFVVCNAIHQFAVLATDTQESAELKIIELAKLYDRTESDYYIDKIDLYIND